MDSPRLTDREREAYHIIRRAAEASGLTPRHSDVAAALTNAGYRSTKGNVGNIVAKLRLLGLVDIAWIGGLEAQQRIYTIPGTKRETRPREAAPGGVPVPWPESSVVDVSWPDLRQAATSYDAAVAAGAFGFHEVRPKSREAIVHRVASPTRQTRSLTGCSAAMEA